MVGQRAQSAYNSRVPQTFHDRLRQSWRRSDSALCVGLDPRLDRIPAPVRRSDRPVFEFCREIVDATADLVCAFKPQIAFFAAERAEHDLEALVAHVHREHPGIPVILDAKRGDIGSTAEQYARELFERYAVDAATVNPYLGWDSIAPYAAYPGRGTVILCLTSNPDSAWLQDHPKEDPAYLRVADMAVANDQGNLMLVVGATHPEQLGKVRIRAPRLPLLVPGVGAQGGDVNGVFARGLDGEGAGLVVNASRSVIYAGAGAVFAKAARHAAIQLRDEMRRARDAVRSTAHS
ncbi:MAG: orotidine-5'-phosphate decarboxylase [Gammaproteobacteria bacterium]|nr:orotidine-5'-phosphate decarboxylase [Gammaproteobacteria bacterium]